MTLTIFGSKYGGGYNVLLALTIPGVLCQMVLHYLLIWGYFQFDSVIWKSSAKHKKELIAAITVVARASGNGDCTRTDALQLQLNNLPCSILSPESGEANSYDGSVAPGVGGHRTLGHAVQSSCGEFFQDEPTPPSLSFFCFVPLGETCIDSVDLYPMHCSDKNLLKQNMPG